MDGHHCGQSVTCIKPDFVLSPSDCLQFAYHLKFKQAQGVKSTSAERRSSDAGKEVLPLLNTVIAEPFRMTPTMLVRMQSLQAILTYNAPIFIAYRKGICLLGMVYCIILFIMCIIGLWVIHILRRSEWEAMAVYH